MNKLIIALVILTVCAAANIKCTEEQKKAKFCTYEFMPVCGIKVDPKNKFSQIKETYGNKCGACATEGVEFYAVGSCDQYPEQATFCHPESYLNKACTREYFPVCGMFDETIQCIQAPCGSNYSNKCSACVNKEVSYFMSGHCEEQNVKTIQI